MATTVISRDGHDISGPTTSIPTNGVSGLFYWDTTRDIPMGCNAAGVFVPIAGTEGVAGVVAAGTNQGTAAALTSGVVNIVTGADGTKGVVLPSTGSDNVDVFNSSTSPLYVYPNGTNTINGGAASASILIRPNTVASFQYDSSTAWSAIATGQNGVVTIGASTAAAGSTTTDAGVLPAATAEAYLTTAADGTKGVRINAADNIAGRSIRVANGVSTAILKIYPPSGGTINGAAADAAFSTVSGKGALLVCTAAGTWYGW